MAQTIYTHVNKCKNDKIKEKGSEGNLIIIMIVSVSLIIVVAYLLLTLITLFKLYTLNNTVYFISNIPQ
jgi:flagellar basal body-associated protein FliL